MPQNNTVELNIATANTSKATKDIKSLKEQIRELKNEMAGMTQGTDEYNQAAAQLGDLMHTQEEITESAKLATADYGQTLSNITSISAGVVGSISAMNGVLNLVGASSDDATEAMKKIQSLMAIVQGLSQIDQAKKAFDGLVTRIKLATAAKKEDTQETIKNSIEEGKNTAATELDTKAKQKNAAASGVATAGNNVLSVSFRNLGRAIKSFMMSNPFTMLIVGATTLIGLFSSLGDEVDSVKNKVDKLKLDMQGPLIVDADDLAGEVGNEVGRQLGKQFVDKLKSENFDKLLKEAVEKNDRTLLWAADKEMGNLEQHLYDTQKRVEKHQLELQNLRNQNLEDTKKYADEYKKLLNAQIENFEYKALKAEYDAASRLITFALKDGLPLAQEELDKITEDWVKEAQNDVKNAYTRVYNQSETIRKNNQKKDNSNNDWKAKLKERQAEELAILKTSYERKKLLTNGLYRDQELTTEEYYDRQLKELQDYLAKWTELRKKHNKENKINEKDLVDGLTQADLLEIEKMNDQEVELERKKTEAIIELRKKLADSMNYRPESSRSSVNEARYQNAQNAMTDETGARYLEQQEELYNAWWVKKYRLMQQYNQAEIEEERRHNDQLNQLAMEKYAEQERVLTENRDGDKAYEEQRFDNEMSYLMQRCEAKLITQEEYNLAVEEQEREHQERMREIDNEYNDGLLEIQTQRTETLRDISQQRYEIELEEFERRKELISSYISAYQSINSAISGILGQALQSAKEGTKKYEEIQEASIIMDTISGSLAAFMSGVKSGIPAPYNFILGGVLSLAALAEGKMALDNLHSKKLSSGASNAPSVSAYETVSYETGAELQGDIQDQRVYVTETDISDTLTRVNVMETESTF